MCLSTLLSKSPLRDTACKRYNKKKIQLLALRKPSSCWVAKAAFSKHGDEGYN